MNKPLLVAELYQVNLFPKDFFLSDIKSLYSNLVLLPQFKDGKNQIIPIPSDAPREIPRITLMSKDAGLECVVGFEKISITWRNTGDTVDWDVTNTVIETVTKTIIDYTYGKIPTNRVGLVYRFYTQFSTKAESVSSFANLLNKKSLLASATEVNLSITTDINIGSITECNKVVNVMTTKRLVDEKPAVTIQADLNNRPNKDKTLNMDNVMQLLSGAREYVNREMLFAEIFG